MNPVEHQSKKIYAAFKASINAGANIIKQPAFSGNYGTQLFREESVRIYG
jgi:hypothetical protein